MKIRIFGIGSAGANALDRLIENGVSIDFVACNTDVQALSRSASTHKIQLGRRITRGLGAGGDPDIGFAAAEEAVEEIKSALSDTPLVLVCVGLGGGTGSGAAPLIVKLAREQGSLVLVCATLPFSFEGKRRDWQAQQSLAAIQQYADAVICFENDRMGELIAGDANIHEAFAGADKIIGQCVYAIVDLVNRRGLIHLGFDDLLAALRNQDARCLFGYGESTGKNRASEALTIALQSPLMDRGTLLGSANNILINIVGGNDLTLSEVQSLMEELSSHISEHTQLLFGAGVNPKMEGKLGVTILSSLTARGNPTLSSGLLSAHGQRSPYGARLGPLRAPIDERFESAQSQSPNIPVSLPTVAPGSGAMLINQESQLVFPNVPMPSRPSPNKIPTDLSSQTNPQSNETVARGRFEKSEPTIENGEDLDVPTFLRRKLKLR